MRITRSRTTTLAALLTAALATGGLAACGSDDGGSTGTAGAGATTPAPAATTEATTTADSTQSAAADGEAVFAANCASCHTLKAADATGQVGPNLDDLQPDEARVVAQVNAGGGPMPAFKGVLSTEEIQAVAQYVSSNAGK